MLNSLRKGAGNIAAKILLLLLVLSFAIWGVGDVFHSFGREKLATIGGREITMPEFERAYQNQLHSISGRIGRQLTSQEIRALNLPQQTLSRLISGAAVDLHAHQLGLGISDEAIIQQILRDDNFHDATGKFSADRYKQILRSSGLTESAFIAEEKTDSIRRQLLGTLAAPVYVPQLLIDAINTYQNETRKVKYFILPASAAGDIPEPTQEQIAAYYENNKAKFTVPEFRKAVLMTLTPAEIKDRIEVKEEDIKAAYEAKKAHLGSPEKRMIEQISFPDMAAAQAARAKLDKNGGDFVAVAKELGFKESDIDLGLNDKSSLSDPKVADAAFSLKEGEISQPVEGKFSVVLLRVTKIVPAVEKSFDDVKDQLRNDLALEAAKSEVTKLTNTVEDQRAGGNSLEDIAKQLSLKTREVTLSRDGTAPDGNRVSDLPDAKDLIPGIFDNDVGVEANPVDVAGGGSVWFEVKDIMPEKVKPLDEVKTDAAKGWRAEELKSRLAQKADEIIKSAGGQDIAALAQPFGAEVKESQALKRTDAEPGLPISAVRLAFTLEKGGFNSVPAGDNGRAIFTVTDIIPPPPLDEKEIAAAKKELAQSLTSDYVSEYLAGLQANYGVQINNKALLALTEPQ